MTTVQTHAEYKPLTQMLLELDEQEDLSPEEDALAEMITLLIEKYEERRYPCLGWRRMNR